MYPRFVPRFVLLVLVVLLAACSNHPTPTAFAPSRATATLAPTSTHAPTATATTPPTLTPSPMPRPQAVRQIESQLETAWGVAQAEIKQSPASQSEVARLAKALAVEPASLGQVYKVEADGAVFYASAETGKSYAIREVPSYFKYENGKEVDVAAHDEGLQVVRLVDDSTEFSHWGNGKVVEVAYANGEHGWIYQGENGEWEKIYESGFDYEAIYQASVRFLEAIGKIEPSATVTPDQVQALLREVGKQYLDDEGYFKMKGRWSAGAYVDESAPWWPSKLFGVNMGPTWVRMETKNGEEINVLVGYLGEPYDKEGNLAVIPIAWGFEKDGKWQSLLSNSHGSPFIQGGGELDDYFRTQKQVEYALKHNRGEKIQVEEIIWITANGLNGAGLARETWQIEEGQKWWYENVGGIAKWWSELSKADRKAILDDIKDPEGKKVIAIAFYLGLIEDKDGSLEQVLQDGGWLPALIDLHEGDWQLEK